MVIPPMQLQKETEKISRTAEEDTSAHSAAAGKNSVSSPRPSAACRILSRRTSGSTGSTTISFLDIRPSPSRPPPRFPHYTISLPPGTRARRCALRLIFHLRRSGEMGDHGREEDVLHAGEKEESA